MYGDATLPYSFCRSVHTFSQCFTPMKALSLSLVLSGVLLYTASSRTRLNRPAQVHEIGSAGGRPRNLQNLAQAAHAAQAPCFQAFAPQKSACPPTWPSVCSQEVEESDGDDDDLEDISLEEMQADVCVVTTPLRDDDVDFGGGGGGGGCGGGGGSGDGGGRRSSRSSRDGTPSPRPREARDAAAAAAADEEAARGPTMSVWRAAASRWMSR